MEATNGDAQGSDNGAGGAGDGGERPQAGESTFSSFDDFLETQPEHVRELFAKKTSGLTSALEKERSNVKTANAQLRGLAKTADPETRERLEKAARENEERSKTLEKELEFTRKAARAGVVDLDLAWAAAKTSGVYDVSELLKAHPSLSGPVKTPDARAGHGTTGRGNGVSDTPAATMTRAIREAAGRD